jgi:hypothetical protein
MEYITSWEEKGIKQGIEQGRADEARRIVLGQVRRRVGPLPGSTEARLEALTLPQLEALSEAVLDFTSLADLEDWLARR